MSVTDQSHVADVGTFVNFHGFTPSAGSGVVRPEEDRGRIQASPTTPAKLPMLTQALFYPQGRPLADQPRGSFRCTTPRTIPTTVPINPTNTTTKLLPDTSDNIPPIVTPAARPVSVYRQNAFMLSANLFLYYCNPTVPLSGNSRDDGPTMIPYSPGTSCHADCCSL